MWGRRRLGGGARVDKHVDAHTSRCAHTCVHVWTYVVCLLWSCTVPTDACAHMHTHTYTHAMRTLTLIHNLITDFVNNLGIKDVEHGSFAYISNSSVSWVLYLNKCLMHIHKHTHNPPYTHTHARTYIHTSMHIPYIYHIYYIYYVYIRCQGQIFNYCQS